MSTEPVVLPGATTALHARVSLLRTVLKAHIEWACDLNCEAVSGQDIRHAVECLTARSGLDETGDHAPGSTAMLLLRIAAESMAAALREMEFLHANVKSSAPVQVAMERWESAEAAMTAALAIARAAGIEVKPW